MRAAALMEHEPGANDPLAIYRGTLNLRATTPPVTSEGAEAIEVRMMAWDLSLLKRHLVAKGIFAAEDIDVAEREYKRYMVLGFLNESIPISTRVDEFWHGHILFTEDYAAMCQHVGGFFVHHRPYTLLQALGIKEMTPEEASKRWGLKIVAGEEVNWRFEPYRRRWGEPDPNWWFLAAACSGDRCGCRGGCRAHRP